MVITKNNLHFQQIDDKILYNLNKYNYETYKLR